MTMGWEESPMSCALAGTCLWSADTVRKTVFMNVTGRAGTSTPVPDVLTGGLRQAFRLHVTYDRPN